MAISVAVAIIGILIARCLYHRKPEIPDAISARFGPLHGLLYNKCYVDEIYDFLFVNGFGKAGGTLLGAFDRNVVDGGVNGAGWLTRFSCQRFDVVGHLDHRWRGTFRLIQREAALVPGVPAPERAGAIVRAVRRDWISGVPGLLRDQITK